MVGHQATESNEHRLFFAAERDSGKGKWDIYQADYRDGRYVNSRLLGDEINSEFYEWSPYVAPDESFLIFGSMDRPDGFGGADLYVSLRSADDKWTRAKNLGDAINSKGNEIYPILSPDGKYLFFVRDGDVYWVDWERVRPERLNPGPSQE